MSTKAAVLSKFLENAAKDPNAQIVILRADGKKEEVEFDSSPEANMLYNLLGGIVTIVGKWYCNGVVILKQREPKEDAPTNVHSLPKPYHTEKVQGDIALVKMNDDASVCVDFTLSDWEAFSSLSAEALEEQEEKAMNEAAEKAEQDQFEIPEEALEEDIEYDEEEDDEEEITDPNEIFKMQLLTKVCAFYQEQHGREPTQEEVKASMKTILEAMAGTAEYENEDEEEGDNELTDKDEKLTVAQNKKETEENQQPQDCVERPAKRMKLSQTKTKTEV